MGGCPGQYFADGVIEGEQALQDGIAGGFYDDGVVGVLDQCCGANARQWSGWIRRCLRPTRTGWAAISLPFSRKSLLMAQASMTQGDMHQDRQCGGRARYRI